MNLIQVALNSTTFYTGGSDVILLLAENGIQPGVLTTLSWMLFTTKLFLGIVIIPLSLKFLYLDSNSQNYYLPGAPIVFSIVIALLGKI